MLTEVFKPRPIFAADRGVYSCLLVPQILERHVEVMTDFPLELVQQHKSKHMDDVEGVLQQVWPALE